jgi:hypothetical protein
MQPSLRSKEWAIQVIRSLAQGLDLPEPLPPGMSQHNFACGLLAVARLALEPGAHEFAMVALRNFLRYHKAEYPILHRDKEKPSHAPSNN